MSQVLPLDVLGAKKVPYKVLGIIWEGKYFGVIRIVNEKGELAVHFLKTLFFSPFDNESLKFLDAESTLHSFKEN